MLGFDRHNDKKRPENEPAYNPNNPVDRKLSRTIFLVVGVLMLILSALIVILVLTGVA